MASPLRITDQVGRIVQLNEPAKRIVSLVPSQTELLYDLGLNEEVVGQTLFCIHPKWAHQSKPRVGGTKTVKLDVIRSLKPDLILANKEENVKEQIEQLEQEFTVYISDIKNLADSYEMIFQVGLLTGKLQEALDLNHQIQASFDSLNSKSTKQKVAYLIWKSPLMAAGKDTFIDAMLQSCGFENVFEFNQGRYPETTIEELNHLNPDFILCSSEPFPFKEKHLEELSGSGLKAKMILVDGELFSWYGSKLAKAPVYFKALLNELHVG